MAASHAFATSCLHWAKVWPPSGGTIPLNAQIVVFDFDLPTSSNPVLVGNSGTVPLAIGATYSTSPYGGRYTTTLIPIKPLKPKTKYELHLLNPKASRLWSDYEKLEAQIGEWNNPKWKPFYWITTQHEDHDAPAWYSRPIISHANNSGPDWPQQSEINVLIPVNDDLCIAMVDVIAERKYLIRNLVPIQESTIRLSSEMCTGNFNLQGGDRYQMIITIIDASGNRSTASDPITFCVPDYRPPDEYLVDIRLEPAIKPIHQTQLQWSEPAKKARIMGKIELLLIVSPDGLVDQIEIIKGLPMGLSDATEKTIRTWTFAPTDSGTVREVHAVVTFKIVTPPYEPNWNP